MSKFDAVLEMIEGPRVDEEAVPEDDALDETKYMGHGGTVAGPHMTSDQERMSDEVFQYASNEGRFYKNKDAKGAVAWAIREYVKYKNREMREDGNVIQKHVVKALASYWRRN